MFNIECPGEAHELDNNFNPSSQGPYGPGYHDCNVCYGDGFVTPLIYEQWQQEQLVNRILRSKQFKIGD